MKTVVIMLSVIVLGANACIGKGKTSTQQNTSHFLKLQASLSLQKLPYQRQLFSFLIPMQVI